MATYNGEKYLHQQLDSILTQTYSNIELIIVDDTSIDSTISIIKQYQSKYNNIMVIQNKQNVGVVKSFELAINNCKGEFIALADQDDIWFKNKLEELYNNIGNAKLIHSDAILIDDNQQTISLSHMQYSKSMRYKNTVDYLFGNNVTGCCVMFRRSFWEQIHPIPDDFYVHDHYLAIMASIMHGIKYYPAPLIYYRQHSENTIGAKIKDYDIFIKNLQQVRNSVALLKNIPQFNSNYSSDIDHALQYYDAIINHKPISLKLTIWIYKHVPLKKFCGFIAFTCFGHNVAKFIYSKLR